MGGDEAEAEADDISRMYSAPTMTLPTEEALTLWRTCLDNREYTLKCTHQVHTYSNLTTVVIYSIYIMYALTEHQIFIAFHCSSFSGDESL